MGTSPLSSSVKRLEQFVNEALDDGIVTFSELTAKGISKTPLALIRKHEPSNFGLQFLDSIAAAVGMEPWEILCSLSAEAVKAAFLVQSLTSDSSRRGAVARLNFEVMERLREQEENLLASHVRAATPSVDSSNGLDAALSTARTKAREAKSRGKIRRPKAT